MRLFRKKALGTGHQGGMKKSIEDKLPDNINPNLCIHNEYCHTRIQQSWNCLRAESNVCGQVKKYYDKYGEGGSQLGI